MPNPDQSDVDGDGYGDVCDNCPGDANEDQDDDDADGLGNECDNCPSTANASQSDLDGDLIGDHCDNCVDVLNKRQEDFDGDGYGNLCDNCRGVPNDQADNDQDGRGRLAIRSEAVARTYYPEAAEELSNGVFRTSDLGRLEQGELTLITSEGEHTYRPGDTCALDADTVHAERAGSSGARGLLGKKSP